MYNKINHYTIITCISSFYIALYYFQVLEEFWKTNIGIRKCLVRRKMKQNITPKQLLTSARLLSKLERDLIFELTEFTLAAPNFA